jgi:hypothetical protein
MEKIPITHYNGHIFEALVYDPERKILIYKENEIPWKLTKKSSFSKKINDNKDYIDNAAIIPDEKGVKRKIFKEKLEKVLTRKADSQTTQRGAIISSTRSGQAIPATQPEREVGDLLSRQLLAFYEQKDKEEKELIEKYLKSQSIAGSEILRVKGNTLLICTHNIKDR